jgi:hypothetical protein
MAVGAAWLIVIALVIAALASITRRKPGRTGAAAAGAVYDLLQEDKRNAIEVIVQERAGERDEEHADAIPPDAGQSP